MLGANRGPYGTHRQRRSAFEDKFLVEAGGDPKRAEALRKAYFRPFALKSAKARRQRRLTAPRKPVGHIEKVLAEVADLTDAQRSTLAELLRPARRNGGAS